MQKSWKLYKKLHRWPGLIIAFFLLYYAFTGIILNHRELFSGIDMCRTILPKNYNYNNWNNASLKGNLIINNDSILIYGNIGIWLTDSSFTEYKPFHSGFPDGIDKRKIFDLHLAHDGNLYAAAFSGIYAYNREKSIWKKLTTDKKSERFTGIASVSDTLYALSRSYLYAGTSHGIHTKLTRKELPPPIDYVNKVTLFQTIWQIHSGEIFGLPGKLYVDVLGIITLFLSVTGIIYFFAPSWIRSRVKRKKTTAAISRTGSWSLKWHNLVGSWTFILLIILFFTGIFLRPPLLIAIANASMHPLKYSHLDQPNPWHDKLRDIIYDPARDVFLLSTSDGMYFMNLKELVPERFETQPPVSIMGINVLENATDNCYMIGSFSGFFLWNPEEQSVIDLYTGQPYTPSAYGRPVGDMKITGFITGFKGRLYIADYDNGIVPYKHSFKFPEMPENILSESGMSLWSVCLEIHTGRFFQNITGDFYILIVPLSGLTAIIIVISGYILWRRKHRNGLSREEE